MTPDVSKATIMVLLILTIIISVLSTIIVLDKAEQIQVPQKPVSEQQNTGYVTLTIAPPDQQDSTAGEVRMQIVNK